MTARQQFAMSELIGLGLHPFGAAAVVGNGCGESGVNLDSTFDRGARANFGSGGFLEWRDSEGAPRKTRLSVYADERGPGLRDDLGVQCHYAADELTKYFSSLDAQLRNPGTRQIKNLTANFCWVFENPARVTAGLDNRIAHAERAYADWTATQAAGVGAGAPSPRPPIPSAPPMPPTPPPAIVPAVVPAPLAIDAPNTQRQSAVLGNMRSIQRTYMDQIAVLEKEKAVIDAAIEVFSGFLPLLPPAVKAIQPQRKAPMFKNWQTTLAGSGALLGAVAAILHSVSVGQMPDITQLGILFAAVSSGIGLINAKDANVTGGTIPQTVEAAKRTGTPV